MDLASAAAGPSGVEQLPSAAGQALPFAADEGDQDHYFVLEQLANYLEDEDARSKSARVERALNTDATTSPPSTPGARPARPSPRRRRRCKRCTDTKICIHCACSSRSRDPSKDLGILARAALQRRQGWSEKEASAVRGVLQLERQHLSDARIAQDEAARALRAAERRIQELELTLQHRTAQLGEANARIDVLETQVRASSKQSREEAAIGLSTAGALQQEVAVLHKRLRSAQEDAEREHEATKEAALRERAALARVAKMEAAVAEAKGRASRATEEARQSRQDADSWKRAAEKAASVAERAEASLSARDSQVACSERGAYELRRQLDAALEVAERCRGERDDARARLARAEAELSDVQAALDARGGGGCCGERGVAAQVADVDPEAAALLARHETAVQSAERMCAQVNAPGGVAGFHPGAPAAPRREQPPYGVAAAPLSDAARGFSAGGGGGPETCVLELAKLTDSERAEVMQAQLDSLRRQNAVLRRKLAFARDDAQVFSAEADGLRQQVVGLEQAFGEVAGVAQARAGAGSTSAPSASLTSSEGERAEQEEPSAEAELRAQLAQLRQQQGMLARLLATQPGAAAFEQPDL
ncbi:unnamed protein product [Pedinophyceae sp. YPF-701]|nr:unnamed protein product [Pedinophyceae sp. YPF-701]